MRTTIHTLLLIGFDAAEFEITVVGTYLSFANAQKALKEQGKELLAEYDTPIDESITKYLDDADTTFEFKGEDDWSGFRLEIHESQMTDEPDTNVETIHLTADEVRRLIAWKYDPSNAFFDGEIMARNYTTDDDDWTGISAGNDFNYLAKDDDYDVCDEWGPFEIWDCPVELAASIRDFLNEFPTVEDALALIDDFTL